MFPLSFTKENLTLAGMVLFIIVFLLGTFKYLRNDKRIVQIVLFLMILFGIELLLIKIEIINIQYFEAINLIAVPLIYTISYQFLRKIFIQLYGMEPTYNKSSWHDYEEGRRQNIGDMIVFFVPLFSSILIPIFCLGS